MLTQGRPLERSPQKTKPRNNFLLPSLPTLPTTDIPTIVQPKFQSARTHMGKIANALPPLSTLGHRTERLAPLKTPPSVPSRLPGSKLSQQLSLRRLSSTKGPRNSQAESLVKAKGREFSARLRERTSRASQHIWYRDTKTGTNEFTSIAHLKNFLRKFKEIDVKGTGKVSLAMVETYLTSTYHSSSACLAFIAMFTELNFPGQIFSNVKKLDYLLTTVTEFTFHHFLQLAFPTAPAKAISKMFESVRDTSEVSDEDTLQAAWREQMQLRAAEQIQWVKTMWPVWDSDGSGELDEKEFKAIVQSIGASINDAERFFTEIDTDTNGTISMQEFLNWWLGRGTKSYPSFLNPTC